MKIKINIKRNYVSLFLIFFLILLLSIYSINFNKPKLKSQLLIANQWLNSFDLGYSSLNNINHDGSIKFQGDFNQSIFVKIGSLLINTPKVLVYKIKTYINPIFETIYIDINFKNYQILLKDREKVLHQGNAVNYKFTEVPGYLWFEGERKRISIRLKGDLKTHWRTERRMSLKIQLKNGESVMGYNEFSIQKPRDRQWPYNYFSEIAANEMGILSSNSSLIKVVVNGEKWGVMLAEENLGKMYLENKRKKESLIFRFGDERIWLEGFVKDSFYLYRLGDPALIYNVYNINKHFLDDNKKENHKNREIISYVVKKFSNYDSSLFKTEDMLKSFFLAQAWGNFHALVNNNTSYYFNPYTLQLEPIIRDQYGITKIKNNQTILLWPPPIQYLKSLENEDFLKKNKIINSIEEIIPRLNDERLFVKEKFPVDALKDITTLNSNLLSIKKDKDHYLNFNPKDFYKKIKNGIYFDYLKLETMNNKQNGSLIQNIKQRERISEIVNFVHYANGDIEIFNLIPDNIIIHELNFNGNNLLKNKIILPSYLSENKSIIIKTDIRGIQDNNFILVSSYKNIKHSINNKNTLFKDIKNPLTETTEIPKFISKDNNIFKIDPGIWFVQDDLVLNGNLIINPGTTLKFSENTSLIINGSINAVGTKENKIIMESSETFWNGLYVYNSSNKSSLSNVEIKNTIGINKGILQLTGGTVFYNSPINIKDVIFQNTQAEDALNIINSNYEIHNVKFYNSKSDGFDSDYSSGTIYNSKFKNIGGDALDFSGSRVTIKNMSALKVKDKAISVGENSSIKVSDVDFQDIGVGIANKDGSDTTAKNCNIRNPYLAGLMTYIKKKNYKSKTIMKVENCKVEFSKIKKTQQISNNRKKYISQTGTTLIVDKNNTVIAEYVDVDKLYKNSIMKKN